MQEATAGLPGGLKMTTWKTSLFQDEPYVDNYREFRQQRGPPISPIEAPETLPGLPEGLDPGQLPTAEMLRESLAAADHAALHPEVPLALPNLAICARNLVCACTLKCMNSQSLLVTDAGLNVSSKDVSDQK